MKLFVFGDSYVDTGNWDKSSGSWHSPYGSTFPGKPTGRFSDGRVLTDYIGHFSLLLDLFVFCPSYKTRKTTFYRTFCDRKHPPFFNEAKELSIEQHCRSAVALLKCFDAFFSRFRATRHRRPRFSRTEDKFVPRHQRETDNS